MFAAHPRIAPEKVVRRGYQEAIAAEAVARNTLVILPTGMGKTVIALLVVAERLVEGGKAILLAPTKPLVEQHAKFFGDHLVGIPVHTLTGEISPEDRALAWASPGLVCSTPQVLSNDLRKETARLQDVSVVIFDEAHRAVGDYAYAGIARAYREAAPRGRVLGMTASPGADADKIAEVMDNLGIDGIEIRTEQDPDMQAYTQRIDLQPIEVAMPPQVERLGQLLRAALKDCVTELQRVGVLRGGEPGIRDLLEAQRRLGARANEAGREDAGEIFHLLSANARALKLSHAVEMCETQGLGALRAYLSRMEHDPSRAAKAILRDARVDEARRLLATSRVEHPKLRKVALLLQELVRGKTAAKAIVFAHYRDTAEVLQEELTRVEGLKPVRFVGQATKGEDKGLSQKEQARILDAFRAGEHNVLIATSVAEEGLDVPNTDLVVFYEPVPSEIRSIQRRGRTGRNAPGRVVVLLTKGTRDVASYWTARRKERAMRSEVDHLRQRFSRVNASWERPQGQLTLARFGGAVEVDHRVANGPLASALRARGVELRPETIPGATFRAGATAVRVVEEGDLATPAARVRIEAELRALARFDRAIVVVVGESVEAEAARRTWNERGILVKSARDARESADVIAGLLGEAAS